MKRGDLIKKLEGMDCVFIRHGSKHDWYQNPRSLSDLGLELQFSYHEAEKTHILRFYRPF
jgi:mRNA interferase HicA